MLLRNDSQLCFTLLINLTHDDGVQREFELSVGDPVKIAYRYNGERLVTQGKVTKIQPVIHSSIISPTTYCTASSIANSAIIHVDSSATYSSGIVKVRVEDIIDCIKLNTTDEDHFDDIGDGSGNSSSNGSSSYPPDYSCSILPSDNPTIGNGLEGMVVDIIKRD